jgi:hypothetical protein
MKPNFYRTPPGTQGWHPRTYPCERQMDHLAINIIIPAGAFLEYVTQDWLRIEHLSFIDVQPRTQLSPRFTTKRFRDNT